MDTQIFAERGVVALTKSAQSSTGDEDVTMKISRRYSPAVYGLIAGSSALLGLDRDGLAQIVFELP